MVCSCSSGLSSRKPTDLVKQSIPFSYMAVSAGDYICYDSKTKIDFISIAATDGKSHSVQVYSDISAEWVSGDNSLTVNWNSTTSGSILTHQVQQYQHVWVISRAECWL